MEDKLLLLQIAYSIVGDSLDYTTMSIDSRVDEVRRVYLQLVSLVAEGNERDQKQAIQ
jgi:hypothetical protein